MCVMEIHPRSPRPSIIQAVTHNLFTIVGDLEMANEVAVSRDDSKLKEFVNAMSAIVAQAYNLALDEFGHECEGLEINHVRAAQFEGKNT